MKSSSKSQKHSSPMHPSYHHVQIKPTVQSRYQRNYTMNVKARKNELRKKIHAKMAQNTPDYINEQSKLATMNIIQSPEYQSARSLTLFISMPSEFQTSALIRDALSSHKHVFVPRCIGAGHMKLLELYNEDDLQTFVTSRFGIPEPSVIIPPTTLQTISHRFPDLDISSTINTAVPRHDVIQPECLAELDLIICPFVAANPHGHRLGYGGGFFDRFLLHVQQLRQELDLKHPVGLFGVGLPEQLVIGGLQDTALTNSNDTKNHHSVSDEKSDEKCNAVSASSTHDLSVNDDVIPLDVTDITLDRIFTGSRVFSHGNVPFFFR